MLYFTIALFLLFIAMFSFSSFLYFLIRQLLPNPQNPDIYEAFTWVSSLLIFPFVLLGVHWGTGKITRPLEGRYSLSVITVGSLLGIAFFLWQLFNFFAYMSEWSPLYDILLHGIFAIAIGMIFAYSGKEHYRYIYWFVFPVIAFLVLSASWFYYYFFSRAIQSPNISIVLYPISQAMQGVFYDFHQYGNYYRFLAPILNFINTFCSGGKPDLSVFYGAVVWFGTGMFLILWFALKRIFSRYNFVYAVLIFGALLFVLTQGPQYWAYNPIRVFCAVMAIYLVSIMNPRENGWRQTLKMVLWGGFCGFSLAWNLDTGVAVAIASGILVLTRSVHWSPWRFQYRELLFFAAAFAVSMVGIILWFSVQEGKLFDFSASIFYQKKFYIDGFYMLPMPSFLKSAWLGILCIYGAGTIIPTKHWLDNRYTKLDQIQLFVSLLGLGLFTYYTGRSHDHCLRAVCWPSFLVIGCFIARFTLSGRFKKRCGKIGSLLFFQKTIFCLLIAFFAVLEGFSLSYNFDGYSQCLYNNFSQNTWCSIDWSHEAVQFIKKHATPDLKVNITGGPYCYQGYLYYMSGTISSHPGMNNIEFLDFPPLLLQTDCPLILYGSSQDRENLFLGLHANGISEQFLKEHYDLVETSPPSPDNMTLYCYRRKHCLKKE